MKYVEYTCKLDEYLYDCDYCLIVFFIESW